jgi:two-component system LytT family sensor kinase
MKRSPFPVIRYKILHIIFWIWATASLVHEYQISSKHSNLIVHIGYALIFIFFEILSVYFIIGFLTTHYFNKQKYLQFTTLALFIILITAIFAEVTADIYYYIRHGMHSRLSYVYVFSHFVDTIIKTVLFMAVIVIQNRIDTANQNKLIERDRLETELNFLKAQINPHFLFNALNSIYVLMKEDIKLSEQTLLKFSSLLRYQLYDCNSNETTLEKEIQFLKDYIDLEKVRNGETLIVDFTIPEKTTYFKIAPFILIPFVENAFKHISHFTDKPNNVEIKMNITENKFLFEVENSFEEGLLSENNKHKGIGLQNVKRRLELLYPSKHLLQINQNEEKYSVKLSIEIDGN